MARKVDHGRVMTPAQAAVVGLMDDKGYSVAENITAQLRGALNRQAAASEARRLAVPPPANRGGKSSGGSAGDVVTLVLEDGKIKEVPKRRGYGASAAFVDWLNFTVGVETFDAEDCTVLEGTSLHDDEKLIPLTPDEYSIAMSRVLKRIFGYGISHQLPYGMHFYESSYQMGDGWGTVSVGGQRETVLVSISGQGLSAAAEGWETRLQEFLEGASRARITRVDLAHDDYAGATYNVDRADQEHTQGLFNCGGRNPRCEYRGDWKNPDGKGRSFYVGNRKNGKFCRVYEKGRELGSPASEWVRVEVEFKSVDRVIPFDVLTAPGEYLAAAYPAFAWIDTHQERIETTARVVQSGVDRAVKVVRHQFGSYIHHLVELFGVDEFLSKVCRNDKVPAFAKVPHFGLAGPSIHEVRYPKPAINLSAAASAW